MKRSLKLFVVIFAFALIISTLFSCVNNGESVKTTGNTLNNDPENTVDSGPQDVGSENIGTPSEEPEIPVTPEVKLEEIDITKFNIVRPTDTSETIIYAASDIYDFVQAETGASIYIKKDEKFAASDENYEILVGNTNRAETKALLSGLSDIQWGISFVGKKIVIAGSTDGMTSEAVRYFIDNYLKDISEKGIIKVEENESFFSEILSGIRLLDDNGKSIYRIVYREGLSTKANKTDPIVNASVLLKEDLGKITDSTVTLANDNKANFSDENWSKVNEIVVGFANRVETLEFLSGLDADEYGYAVVGNKIIVAGWTSETTALAAEEFLADLEINVINSSDDKTQIKWLYFEPVVKSTGECAKYVPEYEGGKLSDCRALSDNGVEFIIKGTNEAEFSAYCASLEAKGFASYFKNSSAGNSYATYTSTDTMVHTYYAAYENTVRVITSPLASTNLPNVKAESYQKVTEPAVTQMIFDYPSGGASGMCYIFTLEDGSYVIYDIGHNLESDADRLFNLLTSMNKRKDGKIVVAAWFITHEHGDHYGNLGNFFRKYGSKVTVEQFMWNGPTKNESKLSSDGNGYIFEDIFSKIKTYVGDAKIVKPHTGQIIKVRNAEIEVLFTVEDIYPQYIKTLNDASIVTRIKMGGQTFMMLGDAEIQTSNIIMPMYGNYLKSDIVQIAHHGYGLAPFELFEIIDADVAFWPAYEEVVALLTKPTGKGYYGLGYPLLTRGGFLDIFYAYGNNVTIILPYKPGSGTAILTP